MSMCCMTDDKNAEEMPVSLHIRRSRDMWTSPLEEATHRTPQPDTKLMELAKKWSLIHRLDSRHRRHSQDNQHSHKLEQEPGDMNKHQARGGEDWSTLLFP